jgi:transcription antitermination protein NusB
MVGSRHSSRMTALQALYEMDVTAHSLEDILAGLAQEKELPKEVIDFAAELVRGVGAHRDELDDSIRKFAPVFPVEQLNSIDRNILRMAMFEVQFGRDVPVKAVINEAVELAKVFGSETSPRFINGVLGSFVGSITSKRDNSRKE